MSRRVARLGLATTVAVVGLLGVAAPAGAHTTSGPPASNYHTVVAGLTPPAAGVRVTAAADGERIELRVTGHETVVVNGYRGEPYLRVSRHGVDENRSSPAVALNRTRIPTTTPHRTTGPIGPPRWVRISDGSTAVWHDHRVHWMGGDDPTVVREQPDRTHVVAHWTVPVRVDGTPAAVRGTIRWDPPPSALAWWALAVGLGALVLVASRVRPRPTAIVSVAVLGVAEAVHLWGAWPISTSSTLGRVGENLPSIAVIAAAVVTLWVLARRSVWSAAPLLVITGLFALAAGGLADLSTLSHAFPPSRLPAGIARTLVAISLGVGTAVGLEGARRLRAPRPVT